MRRIRASFPSWGHQRGRDDSLAIIGHHEAGNRRKLRLDVFQDPLGEPRGNIMPLFQVVPNDLLAMGNDPGFLRGGPRRINKDPLMGLSARLQFSEQRPSGVIRTNHAAEHGLASQGENIAVHVRGSPELKRFPFNVHHRNGGLGRNTGDGAPDVMVQHQVAKDEHPSP